MKVLLLSNNPARASFKQRFAVYFDILKQNGIDVTVTQNKSGFFRKKKIFKAALNYDCVILHKKGLNPIDAFLLRKYSKKIIYNYDDAVMFKDSNPEKYSASHYLPFKRSVKACDIVLTGSQYLADFARELGAKVKVLPLGLETDKYYIPNIKKDDGNIRLVWIGSETTLRYLEQIKNVLESLGKKYDNLKLRIIGDTFFDLENMEVEKCKWQMDKRSQYLCECDIGLAPLPNDRFSNGKCSFKVLEYGAAKLPVVASPVGTNSSHLIDTKTGFLAETLEQWGDSLTKLIEDETMRNEMGEAGYNVAQEHSIEKIGTKLALFLKEQIG